MAGFDCHSFCARCRDKCKLKDPCIEKLQCTDSKFSNILTSEQRSQLSTPSYKIKQEKHEARKDTLATPSKDNVDSLNPSLVETASASVIGAVDGQGTLQSPDFSEPAEKKQKKVQKKRRQLLKPKLSTDKLVNSSNKPSRSSTDSKVAELDQKFSDRFNRTYSAPTHSPPAGVVRSTNPFIKPADRPTQLTPSSTDLHFYSTQSSSKTD